MALERFANTPTPAAPSTPWTTLNGAITSGALSLAVTSASAFPSLAQFRVLIDSEWLLITAGAGTTTWTVTRGVEGSTPTAHAHGASIFHVLTAAALLRNPRSMTTLGDMEYMAADLGPARLAAPADGDYVTRWTSGVPSWIASGGGGGTPGGSTTQVQFNNAGAFGGFGSWDGTTLNPGVGKRIGLSSSTGSFDFRASEDPVPYLEIGGTFPLVRASIVATNGVPTTIHNSDFTLVNAGNGNYLNMFRSNGTITSPTILNVGDTAGDINFGAWFPSIAFPPGYYDFFAGFGGVVDADYSAYPGAAVAIELRAAVDASGQYGARLTVATNGNVKIGRGSDGAMVALRASASNELSVVEPTSTTALAALKAARFAGSGATVTTSTPVMDITQTWNDGGVVFTGIKANITNTASSSNSLLLDLQVGGSSVCTVRRDGAGTFNGLVQASDLKASGNIEDGANGFIYWATRSCFSSPANGNILLTNNAVTDFGRLQFGGTTASFPALKRSAAILEARLADDSAGAVFQAGGYQSSDGSAGVTAGPFSTISSITVKNGIVTALTGS